MVTKKSTNSTGPRTAKGKAKSSLNAVSHGLTSTRVLPDEVQLVEGFTRELTDFYKPESPLEVLQIQRIAFCRAKLAKLIDIELAGRELARRQIEHQPEMVMARLPQYLDRLKAMALEVIKGQSVLDEFGLAEVELCAMAKEIRDCLEQVNSEERLSQLLPALCGYLSRSNFLQTDGAESLDYRLMVLAERIRKFISKSQINPGNLSAIDQVLVKINMSTVDSKFSLRDSRCQRLGPEGYRLAVERDLAEITGFEAYVLQIPKVVQAFEEMKGWMLRSMDLNADDAERMMKYQTMLERRLSSAIGELLELQKLRPVQARA